MIETYYRVSWDIQTARGMRHFSHEFDDANKATEFFIKKQRKEQFKHRLSEMTLRKMQADRNAPYLDEHGKFHDHGGLHVTILETMMRYTDY